jgi:hypothetical protein
MAGYAGSVPMQRLRAAARRRRLGCAPAAHESHTTNLAVVAPGIAEALLATALGLVAAIPAVVIYNHLARVIAGYCTLLGDASALATVRPMLIRRISARSAVSTGGRPPRRCDFQRQ